MHKKLALKVTLADVYEHTKQLSAFWTEVTNIYRLISFLKRLKWS